MERWEGLFSPLLKTSRGITKALSAIARRTRTPYGTVRRKFYEFKNHGAAALCDVRMAGPRFWNSGPRNNFLSRADKWLVRLYSQLHAGHPGYAIAKLRADWKAGLITTHTQIDPGTGFPRGWSVENLRRHVAPQLPSPQGHLGKMQFEMEIRAPGAKPVSLRFTAAPAKPLTNSKGGKKHA